MAANANDHLFAGSSQIYQSTDQGDHWYDKGGDDTFDRINTIAMNSNQDLFFAAGWSGVYRSTNNGETWSPVNNGLDDTSVDAMAINPADDVIYIGASNSEGNFIYRSDTNGDSWVKKASLERLFVYVFLL